MMSDKYSDEVLKVLHKTIEKASKIEAHSVVLFWVSPFGNLDHRIGYFEDYDDAVQYGYEIYTRCKKANGEDAEVAIYIDGSWKLNYVK